MSNFLDGHTRLAHNFILALQDELFFSDEQMHAYVGQTISLRLIQAIGTGEQKRRKVTGTLDSIDATSLKLTAADGEQFDIALSNIDKANLVYEDA